MGLLMGFDVDLKSTSPHSTPDPAFGGVASANDLVTLCSPNHCICNRSTDDSNHKTFTFAILRKDDG
jgi:hypothetical protein